METNHSAAASAPIPRPLRGATSSVSEARPSLFRRMLALHDRFGFDVICIALAGVIGFGLLFVGLYAWGTM